MNLSHCQIFAKLLSFNLRWHRTRDSLIPHRWSPECWVGWSVLSKFKKKVTNFHNRGAFALMCFLLCLIECLVS